MDSYRTHSTRRAGREQPDHRFMANTIIRKAQKQHFRVATGSLQVHISRGTDKQRAGDTATHKYSRTACQCEQRALQQIELQLEVIF